MKFGEFDINDDDLVGAILAHTLRLGGGAGAIKKGVTLESEDLERLRESGYTRVMAAKLEAGDIHENEAAARLGALFVGPGVVASPVSTGRCNLHARYTGLLHIDQSRVNAANQVSEVMTIATASPGVLVVEGAMLATVKVIPFGVPEVGVERWETLLSGTPALDVTKLGEFQAGLVLTELPGVSQTLLERASRAQRTRLRTLGSRIRREVRCSHDIVAVTRAIETLREDACDPILLLGASAIVDRGDVIPAALERAGGVVEHLGMPVDPGNLLMWGRLGETTVFGLPGCARSLAPSGFDQLLRRFIAGEKIDSSLIRRLGVGGLLKETPERPMPRNLSVERDARKNIAGIVLAAGASQRMGRINKLTLPVGGKPMVARVVDALQASGVSRLIVVTGCDPEAIGSALGTRKVELLHNADYQQGMGTSVSAGVAALGDDIDAALIALGDMPWVETDVIERLINAFSPGADLSIYIPMFGRKRGNPVLWAARHFPELEQLGGDIGGRALFHQHADAICYVDVDSAGVNIDIDTPENVRQLGIDRPDGSD